MRLHLKAAKRGDPVAQNPIGYMHQHAPGRPANPGKTCCRLIIAIQLGRTRSMVHIQELMGPDGIGPTDVGN